MGLSEPNINLNWNRVPSSGGSSSPAASPKAAESARAGVLLRLPEQWDRDPGPQRFGPPRGARSPPSAGGAFAVRPGRPGAPAAGAAGGCGSLRYCPAPLHSPRLLFVPSGSTKETVACFLGAEAYARPVVQEFCGFSQSVVY